MAAQIIRKTFKYRIYPTKRQAAQLDSTLALCCELYNAALQERRDAWILQRKSISYFDQTVQLVDIKRERPDIATINVSALENVLKRVDRAFRAFFRRCKTGEKPGYPRFRPVRRYNSITIRQIGKALKGHTLRLPKIGKVRIKLHRPIEGEIKTLTIKREAGRWFAFFVTECAMPEPLPFSDRAIGIDVGISSFATFSDGSSIGNPRFYEAGERQRRIAARKVARRKKGSKRRRKAVQLLQRAHAYVRNQRADFHHKLSRAIVNDYGLIVVEDLNVKGLAGGMLAKQVNDAGWASFIHKGAYKAEWAGRTLMKVNPFGTSQTCICGATVRKTLSMREHVCVSCGLVANRDHVSGQIILGRGLRLHALTSPVAECVA